MKSKLKLKKMRPIKAFKDVKVKIYFTLGRGVALYIFGRAPRIVVDVAEHHLPVRAIEKKLVASGRLPIEDVKKVITKIKSGDTEKHLFGDTAVISTTY